MEFNWDKNNFRSDYDLVQSISVLYLTLCVLIGIIAFTTEYYFEYPLVIKISVFIELIILFIINVIKWCLPGYYHRIPYLRRSIINLGLYSAFITWSIFSLITLSIYDLAIPGMMVLLASAGLASSSALIFTIRYSTVRNCIFIIFLPVLLWALMHREKESYLLLTLSVVYTAMLIKSLKVNIERYHDTFLNINSLNSRTSDLVQNNEELQIEILYQQKIEKALRKNEERYRTLFLNNPIESIIVDQNGKITDYNNAKARTKGRVPAIGETMYVDYGSKHNNDMFSELMDCIKTGKQKEFPEQKYNKRFLHIKISPFNSGAIITAIDITKRKLAEGRIQTLTREILRIQENERKRIARDLHDSVAQDLSSLRISCETFFDDHHNNIFKIRYKIKEISKVLHGAIHALRDIAYELRPPSLDELGLPITLYRYCEEFSSKSGIEVDFFSAGLEKNLVDPDTEINLYRIVQESLSNIKKHAQARTVSIRLVASYPNIILRIKDNGIGFESGLQASVSSKNKRMGLRSMEERVSLLRGKIEIQSNPGQGTRVLVEVPGLNCEGEGQDDLLRAPAVEKKTNISVAVN